MTSSKRRFLIAGFASVAAISLIGVGFASWVFKPINVDSKQGSASVHVVSMVEKGTISILSSPEIATFGRGSGRKDDLTDGISFYSKDEEDGKTRYLEKDEVKLRYDPIDEKDSIDGNSWRLFVSIEDEALSNLVCLTSTYESADDAFGGLDFSSDVKTYSGTVGSYFEYTLRLNQAIQYKSKETKPLSESAYSSLYSVLDSSSCKITVKFVVV